MNFVLLFVSNLLATTVASGARVEVQANGAINIASQGTLNVGASDSDLAAKVEELETWKTTMEAQMEHVMKTIAVITPPPSSPPSLPPLPYRLKTLYDDKCLDYGYLDSGVYGGYAVKMYTCTGASNQQWYFDGQQLKTLYDDKCLDYGYLDSGFYGGYAVKMNTCTAASNQQWSGA